MNLLTLDLGTTVLKAGLWSEGRLVAEHHAALGLQIRGEEAVQDANEWWSHTIVLVRELNPSKVDAIGVTGQMHAVVPIDSAGHPLAAVPVVRDRRAHAATAELAADPGWPAIHQMTGGRLDVTCVLPKLRHLTGGADPAWREAAWLLPPKDYLRFRLTNEAATDPIDAAGTLLWNPGTCAWESDLADLAGVRAAQLPPVRPTLSVGGQLSTEAARSLGLTAGIPVVTGGGDDIETLGAGVLDTGGFFEHFGTTGSLYLSTDRFILDPSGRVETYPDVVPGRWLMGASTTTAGAALAWARQVLALDPARNAEVELPALNDAPGHLLFLPFLAGERGPWWNDRLTGSWLGLRPEHSAADLYRAAVEGVLYSLHSLLADLLPFAPSADGAVHTAGPLGLDPRGAQARADLYGRTVRRLGRLPQSTSMAAALLTEATLTGADPHDLARSRLDPVWQYRPGPSAPAWTDGALRYRRAVEEAIAACGKENLS